MREGIFKKWWTAITEPWRHSWRHSQEHHHGLKRNIGNTKADKKRLCPEELLAGNSAEFQTKEKNSGTKGLAAVVVTKTNDETNDRSGRGAYTDNEVSVYNDLISRVEGRAVSAKRDRQTGEKVSKVIRIDQKEKALAILDRIRTTNTVAFAKIGMDPELVANIIKDFENPLNR